MGVSLTLKHIKEVGTGRYEYRRQVPKAALKHLALEGEVSRYCDCLPSKFHIL